MSGTCMDMRISKYGISSVRSRNRKGFRNGRSDVRLVVNNIRGSISNSMVNVSVRNSNRRGKLELGGVGA